MMQKVNVTRVTLLRLKRELAIAKKGYKLLKDKRDGLMKQFMAIIRQARELRVDVERRLGSAFESAVRANVVMPSSVFESLALLPNAHVEVDVEVKNVMSVKVPVFQIEKKGNAFSYGFLDTTGDLDDAMRKLDDVFADIIRLAELEKNAELLAYEIERTRRRVSALEHLRIPQLEETIRFITLQLEERARDAVVATMRVKAMIVAREEEEAREHSAS